MIEIFIRSGPSQVLISEGYDTLALFESTNQPEQPAESLNNKKNFFLHLQHLAENQFLIIKIIFRINIDIAGNDD